MSVIAIVGSAAGGVEELREHLVVPLLDDGHTVTVTLTPTAGLWLDHSGEAALLAEVTGYSVRWKPRLPSDPRPHPKPDLIIAAPMSANSTAKLALGIADNQALTFLCESITVVPTIIFPRINAAHARQPAWKSHMERLRSVAHIIEGPNIWPLFEPRQGGDRPLPWAHITAEVARLAPQL